MLKCTKFDVVWGCSGSVHCCPRVQTPWLDLRGPTSYGRERRKGNVLREGKENGKVDIASGGRGSEG